MDGGVGPMKVLPGQMALASSLSGKTQSQITGDLASNLDAGAALQLATSRSSAQWATSDAGNTACSATG